MCSFPADRTWGHIRDHETKVKYQTVQTGAEQTSPLPVKSKHARFGRVSTVIQAFLHTARSKDTRRATSGPSPMHEPSRCQAVRQPERAARRRDSRPVHLLSLDILWEKAMWAGSDLVATFSVTACTVPCPSWTLPDGSPPSATQITPSLAIARIAGSCSIPRELRRE